MIITKKRAKIQIFESLFFLLQTLPIEKITVTKIVQVANINRRTFYDYFYSKEHLIESIESEVLKELKAIFTTFSKDDALNCFMLVEQSKPLLHNLAICEHIKNYEQFYAARLEDSAFIAHLTQTITNCLSSFSNNKHINAYLAYGTIGYLKEWLNSNCERPIEEVAVDLANAGFYTVIRNAQQTL